MFNTSSLFIIISIIGIVSFYLIMNLLLYIFIYRPMKKHQNEQSRIIYMILKKQYSHDTNLHDISENNEQIMRNITSLSTSIDLFTNELEEKRNTKSYPTPDLVKQITDTIKDQISIEITMSRNMRIANKNSVQKIIETVHKTYPNIELDYIIKKTASIIESMKS